MNGRLSIFYQIFFLIIAGVIAFGSRLLDHPANFTAIGALALISGFLFQSRFSWLLPLGVMLVTDSLLGFYAWPVMLSVYVSFAIIYLLGDRKSVV